MRELYVLMFNDLPHRRPIAENLENFRVERKRFSSTSATMSFPRLPREREFPSRDRRIAIYSNKRTADLSCECDDIAAGK